MGRPGSTRAWCLALATACCAACASAPNQSEAPEPRDPLRIGKAGSQPIFFEKVVVRLPAGTRYGAVYDRARPRRPAQELVHSSKHVETEEFNILVADRMRDLGYETVDPTDAVFTPDSTVRTRFRLVGVITDLNIETWRDFYSPERTRQEAELEMQLRLYDASVKRVVYEKSFHGRASDTGSAAMALPPAVLHAVEGGLSDPQFVELVTAAGSAAVPPDTAILLQPCPAASSRLPESMANVSQAVVTVRQGAATGSGAIISPDGYVLTAAHVANPGKLLSVTLENGIQLEAAVERVDAAADLALLKIPGSGHRCVPLHHGAEIEKGFEVFAIGAPLDERLAGSVTRGIISGRPTIDGSELLQTDASLNVGNSGGPLLDERGAVVGLVVGKFFGLGVEGVGFAVPVESIREHLKLEIDAR